MVALRLLLAAILGTIPAITRAAPGSAELPPPSTRTDVTYAKDVRPIFAANCFRCHGADRQRADIRLDSLAATLKGGEHGKIVLPGDSAKSPLVIAVARIDEGTAMPPVRRSSAGGPPGKEPVEKPLTAEQVGIVRAWIDQGAK